MRQALLLFVLGLLLYNVATMWLDTRVPGSDQGIPVRQLAAVAGVACLILSLTLAVNALLSRGGAEDAVTTLTPEQSLGELERTLRRHQRGRWHTLRGTLRFPVLLTLFSWIIVVGIAIIFRGGSVRSVLACPDGRCTGDWPWEAIWLVGILVILAIGFLTRKRA